MKRLLCVKLKDWISNSVDPDETAHWAVSSRSMLFAKAYYYVRKIKEYGWIHLQGDIFPAITALLGGVKAVYQVLNRSWNLLRKLSTFIRLKRLWCQSFEYAELYVSFDQFQCAGKADSQPCTLSKSRLFKYIENFTSKNWKFSEKTQIFFIFLLKT